MSRIIEVIAGVKDMDAIEVANKIYENTLNFFNLNVRGQKAEEEYHLV